jgi:hypothetical protein
MGDFIEFLGYINGQLHVRGLNRLETMLMPANFSSLVGEFMHTAIVKHCPTLIKNQYHNGHPDLVPLGHYPANAVLHGSAGIEIKASRYQRGWQGHNAEAVWLLVFVFESNTPRDLTAESVRIPFQFKLVAGAQLQESDWTESGRSVTSRRTPTASVTRSGYDKMMENWIYQSSSPSGRAI